ncbi:glycosyltransferase family 4 protein [Haladaptatus sp. DFWS20]|uniref:glycosyltransferase family 4 protein n=1 Tax=Haladaptatus sp. DFWS20 TaxID=3403467 RepID=UPI003EC0F322
MVPLPPLENTGYNGLMSPRLDSVTDTMIAKSESSSEGDLRVLNVIVAAPNDREGAVRAGLQLGDHLAEFASVDTVKMAGRYDTELASELRLQHPFYQIPSQTFPRDLAKRLIQSEKNYSNSLIWTQLTPPDPLDSYDIAHIHNAVPLAGMVAAALQCEMNDLPYCVTTHGISKIPELPKTMNMPWVAKLAFRAGFLSPYRTVLRRASHLFALSASDADILNRKFPAQSVSVVPNGVQPNPPTRDEREQLESTLGISKSDPMLLFVGKVLPGKGVQDLLAANRMVACECEFVLAGSPMDSKLAERLQTSNIRYLEHVSGSLLNKLYRRADVFVFPTRSDVFPLVTLEAMAAATPVISTTVGGIPEQITEETGVLVEPESPALLAEAVERIISDVERRRAMGKAAYERAMQHYSWRSIAETTAERYSRILSST